MPIYRVTTSYVLMGQVMQNVLHFSVEQPGFTMQNIADEIQTNWINVLRLRQDDNGQYTNIEVRNATTPTEAAFNKVIAISGGADFGNSNFPFSAAVLRFQTALSGKHGRGRIFIPGIASADYANGVITANALTTWTNTILTPLRNRFVGPGATSPCKLGVAQRSPLVWNIVTSAELRSTAAALNRRNIGRGI